MIENIKPYQTPSSRKTEVQQMFNNISEKYDLANNVLSLGVHQLWKKKCINILKAYKPNIILDLATGTGDLAILLTQLHPKKIFAADYADKMLQMAQQKILQKKLNHIVEVRKEDGEQLSFEDNFFDAITISFGIRNFENYQKGLQEMYRVLKPGGVLVILEFTMPRNSIIKALYSFYFKYILPIIAWFITRDKKAYDYLPASVQAFPQYEKFCSIIQQQGFSKCTFLPLTGGIATMYIAEK